MIPSCSTSWIVELKVRVKDVIWCMRGNSQVILTIAHPHITFLAMDSQFKHACSTSRISFSSFSLVLWELIACIINPRSMPLNYSNKRSKRYNKQYLSLWQTLFILNFNSLPQSHLLVVTHTHDHRKSVCVTQINVTPTG